MVPLLVEYWKLLKAFERTLDRLPDEHVAKTRAQARYSAGRLDQIAHEYGIDLVVFDGKPFEANLPVIAINGNDFESVAGLIVESTLEPAVVHEMQVLAMGKVILSKGGADVSRR